MTTPRELRHVRVPAQRPPSAVEHRRGAEGERRWQRRYAAVGAHRSRRDHACVAVGVALGSGLGERAVSCPARERDHGVAAARRRALPLPGVGAAGARHRHRRAAAGHEGVRGRAVGVGLVGLAFDVVSVKPWVFGVMPAACLLCVAGRYGLRKVLHRERGRGRCQLAVLAVGQRGRRRPGPPHPSRPVLRLARRGRLHADRHRGRDRGRAGGRRPRLGRPRVQAAATTSSPSAPPPAGAPDGCSGSPGSSRTPPSSWPSTPA